MQGREEAEITLFLFDLDDTLIDTKSAMHKAKQRFKSLNGFSDEDMKQFNSIFYPFSSKEERVLSWREYLQTQTHHEVTPQSCYSTFEDLRLKELSVFPGARKVLEMLDEHQISYAILTNGHPSIQEPKVISSGILDWECCKNIPVFYGYEGDSSVPKPHPKIFHDACKHFDAAHTATVMVGDTMETDILGARNANLGFAIYLQSGATRCDTIDGDVTTKVLHAFSHDHMSELINTLLQQKMD